MDYVITPPEPVSIAVSGSEERFPVRRIFCVGRNYPDFVRETGRNEGEPPLYFFKPADTIVDTGATIVYPPQTLELTYQIELAVALGEGGRNLRPEDAREVIWGAAVALDLSRRDMQMAARRTGRPWDMAKGFPGATPVAPLSRIDAVESISSGRIWLSLNDEIRQEADLSEMIWPVEEHLSVLSHTVDLMPGDLILTGTPGGTGPARVGDRIAGGVEGLTDIDVSIGAPEDVANAEPEEGAGLLDQATPSP
jgi:fumarylpyruvate hydrolase